MDSYKFSETNITVINSLQLRFIFAIVVFSYYYHNN